MWAIVLFIYGSYCIASSFGFNYCSITCNGVKHTMCSYPEVDASCGKVGLTRSEKLLILKVHNQMRQKVATGRESRGPQPPAADMNQLSWDKECARIAQRWAGQCDQDGHDRCRLSWDRTPVGQNIATYSVWGKKPSRNDTIKGMLKDLYDEVKAFSPSRVKSLSLDGVSEIGHYTQIVWANTTRVGCGLLASSDRSKKYYHYKLVCNYKPAGNVLGYPLYKVGQPSSACSSSRSSSQYAGLCLP